KEILQMESEYIFESFINKSLKEQEKKEILEKNVNRVLAVAKTYNDYDFVGLLKYQIKRRKDGFDNQKSQIDECYNDAFRQLRETIEFEIPKYICIFQSLFYRACQIKEKSVINEKPIEKLPLEEFVKMFEIGNSSEFGRMLLERGFPRLATAEIDKQIKKAKKNNNLELDSNEQIVKYILENEEAILANLDDFEKSLFNRIAKQ
ncbi:MAG: hypothetical protein WCX32_03595, partial [Clostridia bacterium]